MNNIYPWATLRPFNAYSNYLKQKFGTRIQKLSVDAGFTCPNRDGSLSFEGCSFCSNDAFNPSYCRRFESITTQIEEGIKFHKRRYRKAPAYFVYFQPYTNTYAPLEVLKQKYEQALSHPQVIGLVIGTRPDCVDEEKLDYLAFLNGKYHITVEYGIESCYDKTLKRINRGHNFDTTVKAIELTKQRGLEVGSHIIFGLPGESRIQMLEQANIISSLQIDSIKFHQLQILENTPMQRDYIEHKEDYQLFSFEEYRDFIISFMENMSPDIKIERFASEVPPRYNAGKSWGEIRNETVVEKIESRMIQLGTYQGKNYNKI